MLVRIVIVTCSTVNTIIVQYSSVFAHLSTLLSCCKQAIKVVHFRPTVFLTKGGPFLSVITKLVYESCVSGWLSSVGSVQSAV